MRNEKTMRGQGGAALILALLMISILSVLVLETLRAMQVEEVGARYFQDSYQAEALAKSGVHLAMVLLKQDAEAGQEEEKEDVDHGGETWSLLPQADTLPKALAEIGTLEGKVRDESGRFPLNALVDREKGEIRQAHQGVLERLLTNPPIGMELEEARALVMAIKDWLDEDEEPSGEFGAEAMYYQSLEEAHGCRNGPLESLAELQLIRGMTAPLYSGMETGFGLKDLLTLHGGDKININTADFLVLQALPGQDVAEDTREEWARSVISYREEPQHWDFLKESDWYRNRMAGFNDINLPAEIITTKSSHFSVQMTGKVGAGRKSIFAYLEREQSGEKEEKGVNVLVRFWQVY